jgi:hypothetical protein
MLPVPSFGVPGISIDRTSLNQDIVRHVKVPDKAGVVGWANIRWRVWKSEWFGIVFREMS